MALNVCAQSACDADLTALLRDTTGDKIREIIRKRHMEHPDWGSRATSLNKDLLLAIHSAEHVILDQMCNIQEIAKASGLKTIPLSVDVSVDPKCSPPNPKVKKDELVTWGAGAIVGNPDSIIRSYHRLKVLLACQNEFAEVIGEKPEPLPAFKMESMSRNFRLTSVDYETRNRSGPAHCAEKDGSIKIIPQVACLLRRDGFWDPLTSKFVPPPPPEAVGSIKTPSFDGPNQLHGVDAAVK